jgi:hypothetical protein
VPGAAAGRNPFASFAPPSFGRDPGAETKLYEVPRELIELARARSSEAERSGTTTPLAPRPDAELEATLRVYTERLSSKPPRVPSLLVAEAAADEAATHGAATRDAVTRDAVTRDAATRDAATRDAAADDAVDVDLEAMDAMAVVAVDAEPAVIDAEPGAAVEPEPLLLERPLCRRSVRVVGPAPSVGVSRAWMMYAALSLLGLASCAHVLLGS